MPRPVTALSLALACLLSSPGHAEEDAFDPDRLEREILVAAADDPVALDFGPDGAVYFAERAGTLKKWDPATRSVARLGRIPSLHQADAGCLGFVLAPDFATSQHLFLLYIPEPEPREIRISRFTLDQGTVSPDSESIVLAIPLEGGNEPAHCGGGLAWDASGHLLAGIGDNSPPQDLPAVHPEQPARDSRRTSANSQDLRGKILRLTPTPAGGYTVPAGNMFSDPSLGRPEIWAMGARNPFRIAVDPATGWVIWGDVGGNVDPALNLGPEGYDELNLSHAPGFYGWPFCSGPNLPWRSFDPATRQPRGDFFNPLLPLNNSPANRGLQNLPAATPPLLWYPTSQSTDWPQLGSGGRSITSGPLYRYHRYPDSPIRLPAALDGAILWGEWMRNFLAVAKVSTTGTLQSVERLMPGTVIRKPTDLRLGPDGALYIAEYGDAWSGNTTGQITRIVYRRGNRPPRAAATATPVAGPAPLRVTFDASSSFDPDPADRDALDYSWRFENDTRTTGPTPTHLFPHPGRFPVELTVRDPHGAENQTTLIIAVGNSPPQVRFTEPADGSFFDHDSPVTYRVEADDAEDGPLAASSVSVQMERRDRLPTADEETAFPGLALMRAGTCFACHRSTDASAGPPYLEIARRHAANPSATDTLVQKILHGSVGAWGQIPMPPHPQHSPQEASLMVDWILSLAARETHPLPDSLEGRLTVPAPSREWGAFANGLVLLTASAIDAGTAEAPPLTHQSTVVLRSRRQMAAAFDHATHTTTQHSLDHSLVARLSADGYIAFDRIRLAGLQTLKVRLQIIAGAEAGLEIRTGSPDGPRLAHHPLPLPAQPNSRAIDITLPLPASATTGPATQTVFFRLAGDPTTCVDLVWIEFL